ncbi:uncharacterized protein PD653_1088 [Nocardioides sp. PD653]|nr:uncharacterized protein PD653B2_0323 [Nocardioides sp. PD653-B2]GAW53685.1 uncharacterized protein PD653_1088 [Nocardioides sp. PD653]
MRDGDEVFGQIQRQARSIADTQGRPAPTSELLTRHALESFMDRLTRTDHANDFVLKGGILLAAYDVRRPTKDVDAEAVSADVSAEHLAQVVRDLSEVDADDGLLFDLASLSVQEIREHDDYPGLRVRVKARLGTQTCQISWDISTGDPIVPSPRRVRVPRVMGADIEMWGYAPETIIAEKGVTILERGITSTRWRDYVDIVRLTNTQELDPHELRRSAEAVARHRGVDLQPIADAIEGYGAVGQAKWAAWRRKEGMEGISEGDLDEQMAHVASTLDPIFRTDPTTASQDPTVAPTVRVLPPPTTI